MDNIILIAIIYATIITIIVVALFLSNNNKSKELERQISKMQDDNEGLINRINELEKTIGEKESEIWQSIKEQEKESKETFSEHEEKISRNIESIKSEAKEYLEKQRIEIDKRISKQEKVARERDALLGNALKQLVNDYEELKKRVDFFSEIESDSKKVNVENDQEERQKLIENALKEINGELTEDSPNVRRSIDDDQEKHSEQVFYCEDKADRTAKNVLDTEQEKVIKKLFETNDNFLITGKAGTGKSFLLDVFAAADRKKVLKLAPTGIAALNIGGVTIHSAFGYHNLEELTVDEINTSTIRIKSEKRLLLREANVIVIDEISMVRADTFNKIDLILRCVCRNEQPFGGKQIVLFGDIFQLPPIAKSSEMRYLKDKYGGIYFFNSSSYKDTPFHFVELTINHRQEEDGAFFEILNRVREGNATEGDIVALNKRVVNDKSDLRRIMTVFPKKNAAERMNKQELDNLEAKEYVYEAKVTYNRNPEYTKNIENLFPIVENLRLKAGALIMMVTNDIAKRWVNGTIGIVKSLENDKIFVIINGTQYEVKPAMFTEREAIYENGQIRYVDTFAVEQFPIVLAYAITIHKSQGMTYQQIACDINECFAPGQAYVALSRCTSMEGLYLLSPIIKDMITVESEVVDFYNNQINRSNNERLI